jgi:hypothetical protein
MNMWWRFVAKRLWPFPPERNTTGLSFEELRARYRKWELAALIPFFGFAAALTVLWFCVLVVVNDFVISNLPANRFVMAPLRMIWFVPALLVGILSSEVPLKITYRTLLGSERFAEYTTYINLHWEVDALRANRHLLLVLGVPLVIFLILAMNWYTVFADNEIIVKRFWSVTPDRYQYAQVQAIGAVSQVRAPNGNVVPRQHFVIKFNDGRVWSTDWSPQGGSDRDLDQAVIEFVSHRSKLKIQKVEFDDEL